MTKYYINENIEKYSIKIPKSTMRKRLHEFNHKKWQYSSFLKIQPLKATIMELPKLIVPKILKTIGT
jgi:hypothetical protein